VLQSVAAYCSVLIQSDGRVLPQVVLCCSVLLQCVVAVQHD